MATPYSILTILWLCLPISLPAQQPSKTHETYRKAYELYLKGEVGKAIDMLDDKQLDASYHEARSRIKQAREKMDRKEEVINRLELEIRQVVKSYVLKAGLYKLLFRYRRAVEASEKATRMLEENEEKPDKEK